MPDAGLRETAPHESPAFDPTRYDRVAPEDRPTEVDERSANLSLAAGLTIADITASVVAYSQGAGPQKGSVIRAAALLRAEPQHCDALADLFAKDSIGVSGRELIMDLLASSGDDKAQATMRKLLTLPIATRDRSAFERMLQRFALVTAPRIESIAFVSEEWQRAKRNKERRIVHAAAYTLGSLAGHAAELRDDALARPVLEVLVRAIRQTAGKPELEDEERGLLAALGNTGMSEALPEIVARTARGDERTRSQAATALRKYDRAEVRAKLIELLGDPDGQVALAAIRSLDIMHIGSGELGALADRATAGKTHGDVSAALVSFFRAHGSVDKAQATRGLRAMGPRAEGRAELTDQILQGLVELR